MRSRVPVATNLKGEIVPLKGARRIAVCMALGELMIPVKEHEVNLEFFSENKKELFVNDYLKIIDKHFSDLPEVWFIVTQYRLEQDSRSSEDCLREQ